MEQKLLDYAAILRPVLELLATLILPILAAKVYQWLGVKTDKDQTEIEKLLRDAIHASAQNALTYALQKHGLKIAEVVPGNIGNVLGTAMDYVQEKNPDALEKLGVTSKNLRDILLSKIPATR